MKITEINHFRHGHKLELSYFETPYQCDGCKELGFGSRYQCNKTKCNFHLHEKCAVADPFVTHSFFENSKFEFKKKGKRGKACKACGKHVQGFMYKSKEIYLHPCCLNLPSTLNGADINGQSSLGLNLESEVSSECLLCRNKEIHKGKLKGWGYVSACGKHCYHVGCVNNMNFENWKTGYFKLKGWDYVSSCGKHCYPVGCVNNMNFENWNMGYFNQLQNGAGRNGLVFIIEGNGESSNGRKERKGRWM